MKIVSLLLSLCLASVALAEEPAELERLRHLWEQSVAKEVDEKNKIYLKSLEKLQKKFTVANNLAAAVAVNDEMQKVKAIKPLEKASPFDGMWLQKYKGFTHLKVIQGAHFADETNQTGTCSVKGGILTIVRADGCKWKLIIDRKNPDVMEGVNISGSKVRWERIKF